MLKTREVVKPAVYPGPGPGPGAGRISVRSKVSPEESQERTKALKNFCRVFIEMVFTQVCIIIINIDYLDLVHRICKQLRNKRVQGTFCFA